MKKATALALLAALVIAAPAYADDTPAGVATDVQAVQKDNQAAAQNKAKLAKDRAAKAKDKATGDMGGQAVDSVKIGADKVGGSANDATKSSDQKSLNSDVNGAVTK